MIPDKYLPLIGILSSGVLVVLVTAFINRGKTSAEKNYLGIKSEDIIISNLHEEILRLSKLVNLLHTEIVRLAELLKTSGIDPGPPKV